MKKRGFCLYVLGVLLGALTMLLWQGHTTKAQTPTTYTIIHTGTLANCAPVVVGQTQSCYAVEGVALSVKGAPYVLVPLLTVTPITGISVNGAPPLSGPTVTITIPTTATTELH